MAITNLTNQRQVFVE